MTQPVQTLFERAMTIFCDGNFQHAQTSSVFSNPVRPILGWGKGFGHGGGG